MVNLNSVEALEEFFFKVFLNDDYIKEGYMEVHTINEKIYEKYLIYQNLIKRCANHDSIYLAKNNNLILRYQSLIKLNPSLRTILLFRSPAEHANSLLSQHIRFIRIQNEDPFVLSYMNWLGHHEFGIGHKPFKLDNYYLKHEYNNDNINYWIQIWIDYYSYSLKVIDNENLILVNYNDFLNMPNETIDKLLKEYGIVYNTKKFDHFQKKSIEVPQINVELFNKANEIYEELNRRKLMIC
jgi:hypothetical protein